MHKNKGVVGKSPKRVSLDEYLKKILDIAINNTSEEYLGCLIAIGDFRDLRNILVSTGGFFCDDDADELNQRWILTLELIDGLVGNLTKRNDELAHHALKLFMDSLKEMIAIYDEKAAQKNRQKDE